MMYLISIIISVLYIILFLFQADPEIDTEWEPIEVYNFVLVLFGIILIIIILVYVLQTSKEE